MWVDSILLLNNNTTNFEGNSFRKNKKLPLHSIYQILDDSLDNFLSIL